MDEYIQSNLQKHCALAHAFVALTLYLNLRSTTMSFKKNLIQSTDLDIMLHHTIYTS